MQGLRAGNELTKKGISKYRIMWTEFDTWRSELKVCHTTIVGKDYHQKSQGDFETPTSEWECSEHEVHKATWTENISSICCCLSSYTDIHRNTLDDVHASKGHKWHEDLSLKAFLHIAEAVILQEPAFATAFLVVQQNQPKHIHPLDWTITCLCASLAGFW